MTPRARPSGDIPRYHRKGRAREGQGGRNRRPRRPPHNPPPQTGVPPGEAGTDNHPGRRRTATPEGQALGTGEGPPAQHKATTHPSRRKETPRAGIKENPDRATRQMTRARPAGYKRNSNPRAPPANPTKKCGAPSQPTPGVTPQPPAEKGETERRPYLHTRHQPLNPRPNTRTSSPNRAGANKGQPASIRTHREPQPGPEADRRRPKPAHVPNPKPKSGGAKGGRTPEPITRTTRR